jgi:transposase
MPRSHPPYAPEFRRRMVELVRSGWSPEELSREFEPTAQAIWNWVRQAERDAGVRDDGLPEVERTELIRLHRENRQLRQEREILSKAAAWWYLPPREVLFVRMGQPDLECGDYVETGKRQTVFGISGSVSAI